MLRPLLRLAAAPPAAAPPAASERALSPSQVLSNYFKPMDVSRFELTREELANALKDCQEAGTGQRLQGVSTSHYIKLPGPHGTYVAPMAVVRHRLTTSHCHLTLDEVKAVRLYSGPAYQPINNFLRQISKVCPVPPPTAEPNLFVARTAAQPRPVGASHHPSPMRASTASPTAPRTS